MSITGPLVSRTVPVLLGAVSSFAYASALLLVLAPDVLGAAPGATRWSDWAGLVAVGVAVATALVLLWRNAPPLSLWRYALLGAGLFVQGHSVALAAASIGAVRGPLPPVPLWALWIGPFLWHAGALLLGSAMLRSFHSAPTAPWQEDVSRLLLLAAVALVLTHWLRLLPLGYSAPGATRYEDFVDLLTPYVVAGPLLLALHHLAPPPRLWAAAITGALLFASGQGLHLSANAVSFASGPAAPAYLWDEEVGHHLWFVGLALLLGVVVLAGRDQVRVPRSLLSWSLVVLLGLTWSANVVEGGLVPLGSLLAFGLCVLGLRSRSSDRAGPGLLVAVSFALALVLLALYGLVLGGFPQPSELGWL